MITLKVKTHLQKHIGASQVIYTDNKYVTNGEFLFSTSEVNLPNIQKDFMPNISMVISHLLMKKLTPVQPIINKANCCILDIRSYIPPVYTHMLKPFLKDSQYQFYTAKTSQEIIEGIEISVSILFIYRGTEFVGMVTPMVCLNTKTCDICNEV